MKGVFVMQFVLYEKFMEFFNVKSLIAVGALVVLAILLLLIARKARFNTRMLSYGALCIAAAFIMSYLRIFKLPNGGTITVASMLPLFLYAAIAGPWAGMTAGICYGLLQFWQDPFFMHPVQFLLDYPLAFGLLGLAGFFKDRLWLGAIVGTAGRFLCAFFSGVIFFAEYANGQNVFLYSLGYNASYLVPDVIICLVLIAVPQFKRIVRSASHAI